MSVDFDFRLGSRAEKERRVGRLDRKDKTLITVGLADTRFIGPNHCGMKEVDDESSIDAINASNADSQQRLICLKYKHEAHALEKPKTIRRRHNAHKSRAPNVCHPSGILKLTRNLVRLRVAANRQAGTVEINHCTPCQGRNREKREQM